MKNKIRLRRTKVHQTRPVVTKWYERHDTGEIFEVIAVDEVDGVVDIQNFDGDVAELDLKTWHELRLERISPPDWNDRGGFYESSNHLTRANSIWESWQQGPHSMH